MTELELQAVRDRCERATAPPWALEEHYRQQYRFAVVQNDPKCCSISVIPPALLPLASDNTEQARADVEFAAHARQDVPALLDALTKLKERVASGSCTLADFDRGDCEHAVGLPGWNISGEHDGLNDTVDAYGKPNGWCWSCWKSYQLAAAQKHIVERMDVGDPDNKKDECSETLCPDCFGRGTKEKQVQTGCSSSMHKVWFDCLRCCGTGYVS